MKTTIKYALLGAAMAVGMPAQAEVTDCDALSATVKKAITAAPDDVLALVKANVAQHESCACEVVKAAIVASEADKNLVASIVEVAIEAAPSNFRIIGQCAVAVAPDALAEVQGVVTKYGAVSGDSGLTAKGGEKGGEKDAHVCPECKQPHDYQDAGSSNVLDFPAGEGGFCGTCNRVWPQGPLNNPEGPTVGTAGGSPLFVPNVQPPLIVSPAVEPPVVSPPVATGNQPQGN